MRCGIRKSLGTLLSLKCESFTSGAKSLLTFKIVFRMGAGSGAKGILSQLDFLKREITEGGFGSVTDDRETFTNRSVPMKTNGLFDVEGVQGEPESRVFIDT